MLERVHFAKLCHSWAKRELQINDHNDNRPAEIADEYLKEIDLILFIPLRMLNREIQRKSQDYIDQRREITISCSFYCTYNSQEIKRNTVAHTTAEQSNLYILKWICEKLRILFQQKIKMR